MFATTFSSDVYRLSWPDNSSPLVGQFVPFGRTIHNPWSDELFSYKKTKNFLLENKKFLTRKNIFSYKKMHPLPWRNNLQSLAKQFTTLGETILNPWKDVEKMMGMQM